MGNHDPCQESKRQYIFEDVEKLANHKSSHPLKGLRIGARAPLWPVSGLAGKMGTSNQERAPKAQQSISAGSFWGNGIEKSFSNLVQLLEPWLISGDWESSGKNRRFLAISAVPIPRDD